ncbi:hypothetical protein [Nibricoccus sp. IMCC34717]|uniref:hypothetical protein n=1 Tax=Nibricoccus sp. IMCC34717 TaxID=3034021 RepID=UPI003850886D
MKRLAIRLCCALVALLGSLTLSSRLGAAEEFESFSTEGLPRAQGITLVVPVPKGWVSRDLQRPGVVKEFRNPETGGRDAFLIVMPPEQGGEASKEKFLQVYLDVMAPRRFFPNVEHLRHEEVTTAGVPAVVFDYNVSVPQLAPEVLQFRTYACIVKGKVVHFQFYTVGPKDEDHRGTMEARVEAVLSALAPAKA